MLPFRKAEELLAGISVQLALGNLFFYRYKTVLFHDDQCMDR